MQRLLTDWYVVIGQFTHTVGYSHVTDFDTPWCRKSSRSYSQQYQEFEDRYNRDVDDQETQPLQPCA
jgi:hypothetical protein